MRRRHVTYGAAFVILVSLLFGLPKTVGGDGDGQIVVAELDTIGGSLAPGADVKLRGLVVGRVVELTATDDGGVRMTLSLQGDQISQIPADVLARVLPATVFGTTYVDLTSKARDVSKTGHLAAGSVIPQDASTATLELQRALDGIDSLVDALGPARLSTVLHSLASALDGNGDDLGSLVDGFGNVTTELRFRVPLVRENLKLLAQNLRTLRDVAPDLLDAVDDTVVVADHLVERRVDLSDLIDSGLALTDETGELLDRTGPGYERNVVGAAIILDALYDNRDGLTQGPRSLDRLLRRAMTITEGGTIRIDATVVSASVHDYYLRRDCPRFGTARGGNC